MKSFYLTAFVFLLTALLLLLGLSVFAQPPQAFKYQAVVRNNSGEILQNQDVGVRISIHDVTAGGTIVYQETFSETTNDFGLVNLQIGTGTPTIGTFTGIDWGSDSKFLETEIDPNGGTTYASMGTSQLLSVPYALYSQRSSLVSNKGTGNIYVGEEVAVNSTGNSNAFVGYQSGFSNTSGYVNTFMGNFSGYSNLTGAGNTFVGNQSGYYNTTGTLNTIIGDRSGLEITEGNRNTYLGYKSGHNNQTGSSNVCIGYKAGFYETGSDKLYIHNEATLSPLIYGDFNNNLLVFNADVGIGTNNPDASLDVYGDGAAIKAQSPTNGSYAVLGAWSDGVLASSTANGGGAFRGYKDAGTGNALTIICHSDNAGAAFFHSGHPGSTENCVNIENYTSGNALYVKNKYGGVAMFVTNNSSPGSVAIFDGAVHVNGTLSKASGSFLIDHPLDPENKFLRHNFVESPENLLIYRDKAELDQNGEALITMPEYYEVLAKEDEATVVLTPIGKPFLTGYDWLPGNRTFKIYGEPGRNVSWVVYADRDDPVMQELRRPVEEDKKADDKLCPKGKLLFPKAYGFPSNRGVFYSDPKEMEADYERRHTEIEKLKKPNH
ncbi:MAG: hypothetical protein K8R86_03595 [Bacteroidales bacterium]|nr:hypothetical protein [Bacteroidales bacterium]